MADGLLTATNALQPVLMLLRTFIQLNLVFANDRLKYFAIAGLERFIFFAIAGTGVGRRNPDIAPRHKNPPFSSFKSHPIWVFSANLHQYIAGVLHLYFEVAVHIPQSGCWECGPSFRVQRSG